ncbi:MAG: ATP phosphoribosyltransferase [Eggerthellaceae bacterium]|nr:ATP phosphoribosyltransferase [Eggerthellaceae bacterium]
MNYVTPVGFRDVVSEEALVREELTSRVKACFAAKGYLPVETPTLEVLDVMEAGGHVPEAPFKFFDSHGDLLAMRPDVTMQVARMCASRSEASGGIEKPLRLRYTQRVFREKTIEAAARELTQCGAECLGVPGREADLELVSMFASALEECGLTQFTIALGSAGVLRDLLSESCASEQWQSAVLQAYHTSNFVYLGELVEAAERASAAKRVSAAERVSTGASGSTVVEPSTDSTATNPSVIDGGAATNSPIGAAATELSASDKNDNSTPSNSSTSDTNSYKLADPALTNPGEVRLEVAQAIFALSRLRGGKQALVEVRGLLEPFGCEESITELEAVYDALVEQGLGDKLLIDFSVMSSFDYYTGLVFEAYAPGLGSPLGGGGRYDNLLASYGAKKIPAAGFAFYLEQVMAARQEAATRETTNNPRPLRIAVPKGSLKEGSVEVLKNAGLDVEGLLDSGRTLMLRNDEVEYLIVRPTDAPIFVSLGAADCGICGEDSLLEASPDVVELVDLKFGGCRFVVAESKGTTEAVEERYRKLGSIRVATKYPNITRSYYAKIGMPVEIVKLHGNIELAPITGMAERIVDITATGTTLRENNLVVVDDVLASTARFFANPSSFRTNPRVGQLADTLYKQAKEN